MLSQKIAKAVGDEINKPATMNKLALLISENLIKKQLENEKKNAKELIKRIEEFEKNMRETAREIVLEELKNESN